MLPLVEYDCLMIPVSSELTARFAWLGGWLVVLVVVWLVVGRFDSSRFWIA